jgi:hypothetical protein
VTSLRLPVSPTHPLRCPLAARRPLAPHLQYGSSSSVKGTDTEVLMNPNLHLVREVGWGDCAMPGGDLARDTYNSKLNFRFQYAHKILCSDCVLMSEML